MHWQTELHHQTFENAKNAKLRMKNINQLKKIWCNVSCNLTLLSVNDVTFSKQRIISKMRSCVRFTLSHTRATHTLTSQQIPIYSRWYPKHVAFTKNSTYLWLKLRFKLLFSWNDKCYHKVFKYCQHMILALRIIANQWDAPWKVALLPQPVLFTNETWLASPMA